MIFVENVCDANIQPYNIKIEREDFECEFCDFKSIQHSQWRNHVEKQHLRKDCEVPKVQRKSNGKVFYCELCDFKTDRKNGLEIHMRKKHAVLEQLDGNNSSESDDDIEDNNNYELSESYWRTGYIEWNDIDLYENVLKAMEQNFWRNKVKKKEMIEEANETRMKRLNKKFMDPIFGVYPVYYCNVKSTNLI